VDIVGSPDLEKYSKVVGDMVLSDMKIIRDVGVREHRGGFIFLCRG